MGLCSSCDVDTYPEEYHNTHCVSECRPAFDPHCGTIRRFTHYNECHHDCYPQYNSVPVIRPTTTVQEYNNPPYNPENYPVRYGQ